SNTVRSKVFAAGGSERRIDIQLRPFVDVVVRVKDQSGNPIPNARVAIVSSEDGERFASNYAVAPLLAAYAYTTGANGEVQLRVARGGKYRVAIGGDGVQTTSMPLFLPPPGAENLAPNPFVAEMMVTADPSLRAAQAAAAAPVTTRLRAQVIDAANGAAVNEFVYIVEPVETNGVIVRTFQREMTSSSGAIEEPLPPGTYRLYVTAPGFLPLTPMEVRVAERADAGVRIPLDRGARISGRVTDENGRPISEVNFDIEHPSLSQKLTITWQQEDGSFSLSGFPAGTMTLIARARGVLTFQTSVTAKPNATLDIRMKSGRSIEGVVTRDGKPVAGAYVYAFTPARGDQYAVSDASGRFTLSGLTNAPYSITATKDDVTGVIDDIDPAVTHDVTINIAEQLAPDSVARVHPIAHDEESESGPAAVTGRVAKNGRAVAGATIVFMRGGNVIDTIQSGKDGTFAVELPHGGRYEVMAADLSGMLERPYTIVRVLRGGETLAIQLGERVIQGNVVTADKHEPLVGARVALVPAKGVAQVMGGSAVTDASGHFRLTTGATGAVSLVATAEGYGSRARPVDVGDAAPVTFELQRVEPLRVRVFDAKTKVPLEARVDLTTADGTVLPLNKQHDGEAMVFWVAEGKYLLHVHTQDHRDKTIEVTAPGAVDVDI
ncbi:MAG: carboxypeptidase-like regulatory domain-containing protein, partial [Acidobacteriota bacterium]|nr:carboxypeptidase-like regulatory domain-containing protein [Acidobacteriota bacterium]